MVNSGRMADRNIDPKRTREIHQIIDERVLRDDDVRPVRFGLVQSGLVTVEDAMHSASNTHDFGSSLSRPASASQPSSSTLSRRAEALELPG
jgi:hypothetical protein